MQFVTKGADRTNLTLSSECHARIPVWLSCSMRAMGWAKGCLGTRFPYGSTKSCQDSRMLSPQRSKTYGCNWPEFATIFMVFFAVTSHLTRAHRHRLHSGKKSMQQYLGGYFDLQQATLDLLTIHLLDSRLCGLHVRKCQETIPTNEPSHNCKLLFCLWPFASCGQHISGGVRVHPGAIFLHNCSIASTRCRKILNNETAKHCAPLTAQR